MNEEISKNISEITDKEKISFAYSAPT